MAFLALDCFEAIEHQLRGRPSKQISAVALVNEAGEHLVNMHGWRWLLRAPATLTPTVGQDWIALPSDFGQIIALEYSTGTGSCVEAVTLEEIHAFRRYGGGPVDTSYAVSYYLPASGVPAPRLEFYPGPSGTLTLWYAATWVAVRQETDPIPVPAWMRPLFLAVVRAFASGYEEQEEGSVDARLLEIMAGPRFQSAAERDRVIQPSYGALIDNEMSHAWWENGTVLDP